MRKTNNPCSVKYYNFEPEIWEGVPSPSKKKHISNIQLQKQAEEEYLSKQKKSPNGQNKLKNSTNQKKDTTGRAIPIEGEWRPDLDSHLVIHSGYHKPNYNMYKKKFGESQGVSDKSTKWEQPKHGVLRPPAKKGKKVQKATKDIISHTDKPKATKGGFQSVTEDVKKMDASDSVNPNIRGQIFEDVNRVSNDNLKMRYEHIDKDNEDFLRRQKMMDDKVNQILGKTGKTLADKKMVSLGKTEEIDEDDLDDMISKDKSGIEEMKSLLMPKRARQVVAEEFGRSTDKKFAEFVNLDKLMDPSTYKKKNMGSLGQYQQQQEKIDKKLGNLGTLEAVDEDGKSMVYEDGESMVYEDDYDDDLGGTISLDNNNQDFNGDDKQKSVINSEIDYPLLDQYKVPSGVLDYTENHYDENSEIDQKILDNKKGQIRKPKSELNSEIDYPLLDQYKVPSGVLNYTENHQDEDSEIDYEILDNTKGQIRKKGGVSIQNYLGYDNDPLGYTNVNSNIDSEFIKKYSINDSLSENAVNEKYKGINSEIDVEILNNNIDDFSTNKEGVLDGIFFKKKNLEKIEEAESQKYVREWVTSVKDHHNKVNRKYRPEIAEQEAKRLELKKQQLEIQNNIHTLQSDKRNPLVFRDLMLDLQTKKEEESQKSNLKFAATEKSQQLTNNQNTYHEKIQKDKDRIATVKNKITSIKIDRAIEYNDRMDDLLSKVPKYNINGYDNLQQYENNKRFDMYYSKDFEEPNPRQEVNKRNFGTAQCGLMIKQDKEDKKNLVEGFSSVVGGFANKLKDQEYYEKEKRRLKFERLAEGDFLESDGNCLDKDLQKFEKYEWVGQSNYLHPWIKFE